MDNEKASIIIPCYNGEQYVDRCMESIYMQQYPLMEVIVVDDGSTDHSKEKIKKWIRKFEQKGHEFRYVYQENQGLGSAINTGLKYVSGEYLSLLDIDDEYLQGAISERVQYLIQNQDIDVVRSNGWRIKGTQKIPFTQYEEEKNIKDVFGALLEGKTYNWAGSYMVRVKPLFEFYPHKEIYQSRYGQNLQILLPLVYKKRCGFIDKPFMNYILREESLSQTIELGVRLEKELKNYQGYRDIRLYLLKLIVQEKKEYDKYLKTINIGYWRSIMQLAVDNKNKKLLKNAYVELNKYEAVSLNDKIQYYGVMCPIYMYVLRIYRKINGIRN